MVWTVSIYNSLTKKKEFFKPMVEGQVSLYVTGFTSYDYSHMGHGRAYIIKRADERECDPLELSAEFCQEFLMDMADLQCLPHTVQPCISDHMDQIKNMIAKVPAFACFLLNDRNLALIFCVLNSEDNRAGERIVIDPRKKNPADFALWKPDAIVTTPTDTIRPPQPAIYMVSDNNRTMDVCGDPEQRHKTFLRPL
ncbi:cysteine--tRNA ligase 2, cytoplasmic [Tanacetum coccineum]